MWSQKEIDDFAQTLRSCKKYRRICMKNIEKLRLLNIRTEQQINQLIEASNKNSDFIEFIAKEFFPQIFSDIIDMFPIVHSKFNPVDLHLIDSVYHTLVREWTHLGSKEREEIFTPLFNVLNEYVKKDSLILIPNSCFGRIALEICKLGYVVESSESDFFSMIITQFVYNNVGVFTIYPYIHVMKGVNDFNDLLKSVDFPSGVACNECYLNGKTSCSCLDPQIFMMNQRLYLTAGKFESQYSNESNKFDCIVTCFSLDLVEDIERRIYIYYDLLKKGGFWINCGVMTNRFNSNPYFLDFCHDDVEEISLKAGFQKLEEKWIDTSFSQDYNTHIKKLLKAQLVVYVK